MKRHLINLFDLLMLPWVFVAAGLLRWVRRFGVGRLPFTRNLLVRLGVLPIIDHYYEPLFQPKHLRYPLSADRNLPGINWDLPGQLALLDKFRFSGELMDIPLRSEGGPGFYFNNGNFESGDAEYWYNLIRLMKPKRIIEIGSGHSTKIASLATKCNENEQENYRCQHICIEPYEMPWLEAIGLQIVRKRVEEMPLDFFQCLDANDVLFIDSSHIIRPQGDVLYEYLEILPMLKPGVIVHIHDIFSPKDYPSSWVQEEIRLWNEQYLLEAFLTDNQSWRILGAVNLLKHRHFDKLKEVCPTLTSIREPGSFYIQRI